MLLEEVLTSGEPTASVCGVMQVPFTKGSSRGHTLCVCVCLCGVCAYVVSMGMLVLVQTGVLQNYMGVCM